jgi:hypothetical protein
MFDILLPAELVGRLVTPRFAIVAVSINSRLVGSGLDLDRVEIQLRAELRQ